MTDPPPRPATPPLALPPSPDALSQPPSHPPSSRAPERLPPHSRAVARFARALALGVLVSVGLTTHYSPLVSIVVGWNVAALAMIFSLWRLIFRNRAAHTRRRAAAEDPGRTVVYVVVLAASAVSVVAATLLASRAKTVSPEVGVELAALCVGALALSWILTHTAYAFRYAHLYYREVDGVGGLEFPGGLDPDDGDFAYFAFTVGMCFQVSDVVVTSKVIRKTVLAHAALSYAYSTFILALTLNLVFGLL